MPYYQVSMGIEPDHVILIKNIMSILNKIDRILQDNHHILFIMFIIRTTYKAYDQALYIHPPDACKVP